MLEQSRWFLTAENGRNVMKEMHKREKNPTKIKHQRCIQVSNVNHNAFSISDTVKPAVPTAPRIKIFKHAFSFFFLITICEDAWRGKRKVKVFLTSLFNLVSIGQFLTLISFA